MSPEAPPKIDLLTRMIARLNAQRACLDEAARYIAELPGPVLEVGLGRGRTYDRLRHLFPDRDVWAFDFAVRCPDSVRPPDALTVLGDFRQTLSAMRPRLGGRAALVHADFGSEDEHEDRRLANDIAPLLVAMLAPGAVLVGDRPLQDAALESLPAPSDTGFSYYLYRRSGIA